MLMTGRPSSFTQEKADRICAALAEGQSLRSICARDDMPAAQTVFEWIRKYDSFADQYARAREQQADGIFEEILEIADDGRNDWMEGKDSPGYTLNGEHVQRSKLRIDARKWMAGKLAPKKYGDKQAVELTGKDGGDLQITVSKTIHAADRD